MNNSSIFIHSLFRSGSTYLFKVFRRNSTKYWCYQEALHEFVAANRNNPDSLLKIGSDDVKKYRHPPLDSAYWSELAAVWPAWKEIIRDDFIYEDYFAKGNEEAGGEYWACLSSAAKCRPVFQECRTAGRIAALKTQLGGFHVYLWRNPWDQWWSYKVTPYFDVANLLIIHARRAPASIRQMRKELALPEFAGNDLSGALSFYSAQPITSEQSYLIFYLLWCLAIREGVAHADMLISIDQLSDSEEYRRDVVSQLNEAGIDGIDFSDCQVPQARYLARDIKFFERLERRAHLWLEEDDWTVEDFDRIRAIREQFQPKSWSMPMSQLAPEDLAEQAVRARELAVRFETETAKRIRQADEQLGQLKDRVQMVEAAAQQSEGLLHGAEQREAEARARVEQALKLVSDAQGLAVEAETRAKQAQVSVLEQQQRADAAEAQALEQQQRAEAAEDQALEQQQRADAAEVRIQELTRRVDELGNSSHHWWLQATALEQHRNALLGSRSWRVTAPLRVVAHPKLALRNVFNHTVHGTINSLQRPLSHLMRVVMQRPGLTYRARRWLTHHPSLRQLLLNVARQQGVLPSASPSVHFEQTATVPADGAAPDLAHLTPHARQIYSQLKNAIENKKA